MQVLLWVALILFIAAIITPRKLGYSLGAVGWLFFALHWMMQPLHYWAIDDYFNVVVTLGVATFCGYFSFLMWKRADELTLLITKAAAVGGIFYFSFAEFSYLNHLLVAAVASQTTEILNVCSVPVIGADWNILTLNNYPVEIILGCTGIESIALFLGVIACVSAPSRRKLAAFFVTVPAIYVLNIARNAFVLTATGYNWFGSPENSFYVSHNIIAKFGSLGALVLLSYLLFKMLPELLNIVTNTFNMLTGGLNRAS
ncbi:MAG: archaeosortase A [Euryarchaeota archaeon]|nr:archaeosortase A [Euryarchaeota archaeon]